MNNMIGALIAILFTFGLSHAAPDDGLLYDKLTDPRFCDTADEFKNTYQFLIKQNDLGFTEPQAVKGALKVARIVLVRTNGSRRCFVFYRSLASIRKKRLKSHSNTLALIMNERKISMYCFKNYF